jgi:energy-converting hydrogenase B subunit D
MENFLVAIATVIAIAMLVAAFMAVNGRHSLAVTILASGLVSLMTAVMFMLLSAPDVAMTEAAIGSGLTTFLFFFVLGRVRGGSND